jgi:uncharacterized protein YciI
LSALTLAYCRDAGRAREARERFYEPHIQYLGSIRHRLCFAGALASVDDAQALGDERLVGSLFVLGATISDTQQLIGGDPYALGAVWESIDFFEVTRSQGVWISGSTGRPIGTRLYAALGPQRESINSDSDAFFHADLRLGASLGQARSTPLDEAMLFKETTLESARKRFAGAMEPPGHKTWEVWAVPLCTGSFTREVG